MTTSSYSNHNPSIRRVLHGVALSMVLICVPSTYAAVTVQANQPLHAVPIGFGGTGIKAHEANFTSSANGINFQQALENANVRVCRTLAYPDYQQPTHDRDYFDANMTALKNRGVIAPILIFYTDYPASAPTPRAPYYTVDGSTTGGTVASNLVYFVKRYTTTPTASYYFPVVYVEVHNEPDLATDYQYTATQYVTKFMSIHNALVTNSVRDNVALCGPVMSRGYYESWTGDTPTEQQVKNETHSKIFDAFLTSSCKNMVDVVTWHGYSNDTADNILNANKHMDGKFLYGRTVTSTNYNQTSITANRGVAALLQSMAANGVPASVRLGITEHGTFQSGLGAFDGAIFNMAMNHFCLYNPRIEFTNSFVFDSYAGEPAGLRFFSSEGYYMKPYWAQWLGNLTGTVVLQKTVTGNNNAAGNPSLLVSATRDSENLYVQVLNRSTSTITDSVTISGMPVQQAVEIRNFSATANPNTSSTANYGGSFSRAFPPRSVTAFKFTLDLLIDYSNGFTSTTNMALNQQSVITGSNLCLLNNTLSSRGSAYFTSMVPVDSFTTEFGVLITKTGNLAADGLTFLIQNTALTAVGNSGSGLGYVGINKSVAVRLEYWGSPSTGYYTRDASGTQVSAFYDLPTSMSPANGNLYNVKAVYEGTNLQVTITNVNTAEVDERNYTVDIPAIVGGSTAYVGFTAGCGATSSTVKIPYWIYQP